MAALQESLRDLGAQHVHWGAKPEDYVVVRDAIVRAIRASSASWSGRTRRRLAPGDHGDRGADAAGRRRSHRHRRRAACRRRVASRCLDSDGCRTSRCADNRRHVLRQTGSARRTLVVSARIRASPRTSADQGLPADTSPIAVGSAEEAWCPGGKLWSERQRDARQSRCRSSMRVERGQFAEEVSRLLRQGVYRKRVTPSSLRTGHRCRRVPRACGAAVQIRALSRVR